MDNKLIEIFIDPRMSRILSDIVRMKRITVKELCERNQGIPRSTMYRLLTRMERAGLIDVVDYRQKRGTVEKTYAIHPGALPGMNGTMKEGVTYPEIAEIFLAFCIEFVNRFRMYAELHPGKADARDVMGYWVAPIFGTEREVQRLAEEFGRLVSGFESRDTEGERKFHSVGFIVSPPSEDPSERSRDRRKEGFGVAG